MGVRKTLMHQMTGYDTRRWLMLLTWFASGMAPGYAVATPAGRATGTISVG
jgi:hypothetical protein